MIETVILQHLSNSLSVPVFMELPSPLPASFVVIEKTGSGEANHIHDAAFAVQSYGGKLREAMELNELVKTAMKDAVSLNSIIRVSLNGDYNFTDTRMKRYRYQAVFDLKYYEGV